MSNRKHACEGLQFRARLQGYKTPKRWQGTPPWSHTGSEEKESGPIAGATILKRGEGKECSGKEKQGTNRPGWLAQEMSSTYGEGHSSAASFINMRKKHLLRQMKRSFGRPGWRRQEIDTTTLMCRASESGLIPRGNSLPPECTLLHIRCRALF